MRNNFLITVGVGVVISLATIIYILNKYEPSVVLLYVLALLLFIFSTFAFSLILYKFSVVQRFEDSKSVYRRCLKKSLVIGSIFVLILLIQYYFNIL